jgi:hypothetical protein
MKILHLVLYSKSEYYDKMKEITSEYYKKYIDIDTYYYYWDENILDEYLLENNELKIKGKETYVPGILVKTIKAFEFFKEKIDTYDYIVRSNISTIINFQKLIPILSQKNYDYGLFFNKKRKKVFYWGSGTSLLFNKKIFHYILNNLDKLNLDIIDDYSIALLLFYNYKNKLELCDLKNYFCENPSLIKNYNDYIIFRNKSINREDDLIIMKKITDFLN